MPLAPEARHAIARLRRRAIAAEFAAIGARATVTAAAVCAVVVLGLHTVDRPIAPAASWALGLVPIAVGALAWAVRRAPDAGTLTAHLDRRLAAGGLLLAGLERDAAAWNADLAARLREIPARMPRVAAGRHALRSVLAVAGVASLALLPVEATRIAGTATTRGLERAIDDARRDVDLAAEAGLLDAQQAEELRRRAEALQQRLLRGDPVAWSDVDALAERVERGQEAGLAGASAVQAAADALAQELGQRPPSARDVAELGRLARRAAELGLLEGLPPDVREALDQLAQRRGVSDPSDAEGHAGAGLEPGALDPERLRQLADALKQQGGVRMQRARDAARGAGGSADDLRRMLEEQGILGPGGGAPGELPVAQGGDGPFDPTPREGGDGAPGRGGLGRGRADAALQHAQDTEVDTSGLHAERLPEGASIPDRWDVAGVGRAEPEVDPRRKDAGPGAGSGAGTPGDVTFGRDLAPRHRDAVRRYFTERSGAGR